MIRHSAFMEKKSLQSSKMQKKIEDQKVLLVTANAGHFMDITGTLDVFLPTW